MWFLYSLFFAIWTSGAAFLVKNLGGFLLWYNYERRHWGLKYITTYAKLTAVFGRMAALESEWWLG